MLDLSNVRYTLYAPSRHQQNRATRPIRVEGGTAYVPLTRGAVALIDAADAMKVAGISWALSLTKDGRMYVKARLNRRAIYLHRFILDAEPGTLVDHKNGDGLDCRRSNIRHATQRQNNTNRPVRGSSASGYKGVSLHRPSRKWCAEISGDRRKHLGLFDTAEAAARAYDDAARAAHGEFARLNFPRPGEQPARVLR